MDVAQDNAERLRHLELIRAVLAYEEEYGAFTDEELDEVTRLMDGPSISRDGTSV
jgi:hypothetical protein